MAEIITSDDITDAWLTDVLRSAGVLDDATNVAAHERTPFGDGESMMSSLSRVTLTYDGDAGAPSSLIIKLASENEIMAFVANVFRFYEREIRFYNELRADATIASPRCFHAEMYDEDRGFVLVLEEVQAHRQVDQIDGLDLADATTAMTTLADLHAPWWGADLSGFAETMIPYDAPLIASAVPDKVKGDWDRARDRLVDSLPADMIALCDRYDRVLPAVAQDMVGPNTMAHGDFRADNLLFDGDGNILVLDYQLMAISHGITDVAYCISQSITTDLASTHGDELIDAYLTQLRSHGIDVDRNEAMRAYRASCVFYLSVPLGVLGTDGLHERAEQLGVTMLQRAAAEILRVEAHLAYP